MRTNRESRRGWIKYYLALGFHSFRYISTNVREWEWIEYEHSKWEKEFNG